MGQLPLIGQLFPIGHHAAQRLPRGVGAHKQVPQHPFPRPLVIGGNPKLLHPALEGRPAGGVRHRLEQAVGNVHHLMGPPLVIADGPLRHGELHLVAVAQNILRPVDHRHRQLRPPDAPQGVLHPPAFYLQLLGIGHMAQLAAAAAAKIGAVRLHPGGGGRTQPLNPPPGGAVSDVLDAHLRPLAPERTPDEHRHPLDPGHPLAAAGAALDHCRIDSALLQHCPCLPSALRILCSSFFLRLENRSSSLYTHPQYFCMYSPSVRASSCPS